MSRAPIRSAPAARVGGGHAMHDDDRETIENEERGCGFLKHSKAYVRSPPRDGDGVLPPFVEFDPPIPYLERSKFRGYEYFPGTEFELAVTGAADFPDTAGGWVRPADIGEGEKRPALQGYTDAVDESLTSTDPPGEIWRHILRTIGSAEGYDHAGQVPQFQTRDLFMHIGKSYYETPEEFVEEVREQGLSKAIPVSESQEPPRIDPGSTRLYLVHPRAVYYEETDTHKPGIIGYVYLHRTVYTEDEKGRFPAWAEEQASGREDMDLVHIGDQIYDDGVRATTVDDIVEENGTTDDPITHRTVSDEGGVRKQGEAIMDAVGDTLGGDGPTATVVEIPRPDECPECGETTEEDTFDDAGGTVTYCPSCGWDNSFTVNAAWVENDLREEEYNDLRAKASDELDAPPGNPSKDELITAFLREWGLL